MLFTALREKYEKDARYYKNIKVKGAGKKLKLIAFIFKQTNCTFII